ncbi:hypothetical protein C0J52_26739 [Blattella germanica]|nr:hypothetical protein C0J52_26739 [Blattella germanica]
MEYNMGLRLGQGYPVPNILQCGPRCPITSVGSDQTVAYNNISLHESSVFKPPYLKFCPKTSYTILFV